VDVGTGPTQFQYVDVYFSRFLETNASADVPA
jgi:hypothetical protein